MEQPNPLNTLSRSDRFAPLHGAVEHDRTTRQLVAAPSRRRRPTGGGGDPDRTRRTTRGGSSVEPEALSNSHRKLS
jgi:hypothetical protein